MGVRAPIVLLFAALVSTQGCSSTSTNPAEATGGGAGAGGTVGDSGPDAPAPCADAGLASDPENCGACGHSCLGGACVEGKCTPTIIFQNDAKKYGTTGTLGPLVVDGDYLFIGDVGDLGSTGLTGALWRMTTDGTDLLRLDEAGTTEVQAVALNAGSLFWTSVEGKVSQVSTAGGAPSTLATEPGGGLRGIAVTTNHVFYVAGPVIKQLYTIGNANVAVTPGLANPSNVALSGGYVYFTTQGAGAADGAVQRVPVDLSNAPPTIKGPVEPLVAGQPIPSALALDATHVFWVTGDGNVHRAAPDGAQVELLHAGTEDPDRAPQGIALDDKYVYWSSWGSCVNAAGCGGKKIHGRVQRVAKVGGAKEILAEGEFLPTGIGVDSKAVYWTNWWFSSVSRLAL